MPFKVEGEARVAFTNVPGQVPQPPDNGELKVQQADGKLITRKVDGTARFTDLRAVEDQLAQGPLADAVNAAATKASVAGIVDAGATGRGLARAATPAAAGEQLRVAAYPNGVPFTWYDKIGPHVDANLISDGSGSIANDQYAITQAVAEASTGSRRKAVIIHRPFQMNAQVEVPGGVSVIGVVPGSITGPLIGATITPRAKMSSCFHVTGHSAVVAGLLGRAAIDPTSSANAVVDIFDGALPTSANALVSVRKNFDNYKVSLYDLQTYGFLQTIDWIDGSVPDIDNILGQQTGCGTLFRNNAMNGTVSRINVEQGSALVTARGRHASLTGMSGATGGPQGIEGTVFTAIRGAQSVSPAFGLRVPPIWITSGLGLKFFDAEPLEVCYTDGMLIQSDSIDAPVSGIEVFGGYGTVNAPGVTGERTGYKVQGVVNSVHIRGVFAVGFSYGLALIGKSAAAGEQAYHCSFEGCRVFNSKISDFVSAYASAGWVTHNLLESQGTNVSSIYEITNSEITGLANTMNASPRRVSPRSNWFAGYGPQHPTGVPTSAQIAGDAAYARSRLYTINGACYLNGA